MSNEVTPAEYEKLIKRLEFHDVTRNSLLVFSFTVVLATLGIALEKEESAWLCLIPYCLIIPFSARISYYRLSSAHINSFLRVYAKERMVFELGTEENPEKIFWRYNLIAWLVNHEMVLLAAASSILFSVKYWCEHGLFSVEDISFQVLSILLIVVVYVITDSTDKYSKMLSTYEGRWKTLYNNPGEEQSKKCNS